MNRLRPLLTAAAMSSLALPLGGWVVPSAPGPSASGGPLGPVTITANFCATPCSVAPGSAQNGNGGFAASAYKAHQTQFLLGYRLPSGSAAPTSLSGVFFCRVPGPDGRPRLKRFELPFARDASYSGQLRTLVPAPAGFEWAGYTSPGFGTGCPDGFTSFSASASVGLPSGPRDPGPLAYRVVVGARVARTGPVVCGSDPFKTATSPELDTICLDAPAKGTGLGQFSSHDRASNSDLGILPGPTVKATAGGTARLRFKARYAGKDPLTPFSIAANTGVPGAEATPTIGSLIPGPYSTNPITVEVPIPAGTKGGTYPVGLVAARDAKTLRFSTGSVVVNKLLGRIRARVRTQWRVQGARTKVLKLKVTGAPRGSRITVRCRGRGCPYRGKRLKGSKANLGKRFKRSLRAGGAIEIRITKSRYIGKFVRYRTRRGALPKAVSRCLPPGTKKPQRKCR